MSLLSRRSICAGAAVLAAALVPATASAATGNPLVARIDPTTGVPKPLAGGAPWTVLGGLAFGPTGTLYVADLGLGPSAQGGIYSLTAPAFAITPVARTAPTTTPTDVVAGGSTLYTLDQDRVLSIVPGAPATQKVLTSGGLYDQYGIEPQFGALAGNMLYTTASLTCASVGGGGAYVIAVDTTTGAQSLVKSFGCTSLRGIAVTPAGQLLVAQGGKTAKIVQLDPQTGAVTTRSSGGALKQPQGIALDAAGDIMVADSVSGVIAVSSQGGQQSPVTTPPAVGGATGIAVGPDGGIYITEAGIPPKLRASAARRQHLRSAGIALRGRLQPHVLRELQRDSVRIPGAIGFSKSGGITERARRPHRAYQAAGAGQPADRDRRAPRQGGHRDDQRHAAGFAQRRARHAHQAARASHLTGTGPAGLGGAGGPGYFRDTPPPEVRVARRTVAACTVSVTSHAQACRLVPRPPSYRDRPLGRRVRHAAVLWGDRLRRLHQQLPAPRDRVPAGLRPAQGALPAAGG